MGFTSSPSSSSSTGSKEMDELMKLFTKYMALTTKKQELEAKLSDIDNEMEDIMEKIRSHPNAAQLQALVEGATKKPNNNNRR